MNEPHGMIAVMSIANPSIAIRMPYGSQVTQNATNIVTNEIINCFCSRCLFSLPAAIPLPISTQQTTNKNNSIRNISNTAKNCSNFFEIGVHFNIHGIIVISNAYHKQYLPNNTIINNITNNKQHICQLSSTLLQQKKRLNFLHNIWVLNLSHFR